jgi:hypothetical protein
MSTLEPQFSFGDYESMKTKRIRPTKEDSASIVKNFVGFKISEVAKLKHPTRVDLIECVNDTI